MGHRANTTAAGFIRPSLEPNVREIYKNACRAAEPILQEAEDPMQFLREAQHRERFYRKAHEGFSSAQSIIAEQLSRLEQLSGRDDQSKRDELVFRKLADVIAWQLIHGQAYIARRLFRGNRPPRLSESSFDSVLVAARKFTSPDFKRFALISDLTSFVQVGDLLCMDAETGQLTIAEVKTGEKNKKIMEFAEFFAAAQCGFALKHFLDEEGDKAVEQLMRVARQGTRMSQIAEIINTGFGRDLDADRDVRVPEGAIEVTGYDDQLSALITASHERGWAIKVIEECLFLGAYRDPMLPVGSVVFRDWFEKCGGRKGFPVANLLQCMHIPLAPPLFFRHLGEEQIFDLLCGRCAVYIGLQLEGFIRLAERRGVSIRWSSRKEAAKLAPGKDFFKVDNRTLLHGTGDDKVVLGDGFFVRILFHGTTPESIVAAIERDFEEQTIESPSESETG